jgi:hypothetical protein
MPIRLDEFDRGGPEDPLELEVMDWLRSNPDWAYTAKEIAKAIGNLAGEDLAHATSDPIHTFEIVVASTTLQMLLMRLVDEGKIVNRNGRDGNSYYTFKK